MRSVDGLVTAECVALFGQGSQGLVALLHQGSDGVDCKLHPGALVVRVRKAGDNGL
jgi:hypothetical protein